MWKHCWHRQRKMEKLAIWKLKLWALEKLSQVSSFGQLLLFCRSQRFAALSDMPDFGRLGWWLCTLKADVLRRFEISHSLTFPRVGLTAFGTTRSGFLFPQGPAMRSEMCLGGYAFKTEWNEAFLYVPESTSTLEPPKDCGTFFEGEDCKKGWYWIFVFQNLPIVWK